MNYNTFHNTVDNALDVGYMHVIIYKVSERGFTSKRRKQVIYGRDKHRNKRNKE